jgi:transcriptional regulator with XRE-family HTH domain
MIDLLRVRKVIKWLIFNDFAENEAAVARKLGYTKSSLSQILNGKVPLSDKFIEKLCNADSNINKVWITDGTGEMLKNTKKIPLYDVDSIGGNNQQIASLDAVSKPSEWIDAGDWFMDATAAIHHYGDSMTEYPSGCILALREVRDFDLVVWGKNYVIETDEYRITKRLQKGKSKEYVVAYSTNTEAYPDGTLIHQPIDIPKQSIRRLAIVLGYVVKEQSSGIVYNIRNKSIV